MIKRFFIFENSIKLVDYPFFDETERAGSQKGGQGDGRRKDARMKSADDCPRGNTLWSEAADPSQYGPSQFQSDHFFPVIGNIFRHFSCVREAGMYARTSRPGTRCYTYSDFFRRKFELNNYFSTTYIFSIATHRVLF